MDVEPTAKAYKDKGMGGLWQRQSAYISEHAFLDKLDKWLRKKKSLRSVHLQESNAMEDLWGIKEWTKTTLWKFC